MRLLGSNNFGHIVGAQHSKPNNDAIRGSQSHRGRKKADRG